MPKRHKPRAGSLQYWPRKRARRPYPVIRSYPDVKEAKPLAFAAYKAGMTSVTIIDTRKGSPTSGQEVVWAASVLECPPMLVIGARAYSKGKALADFYSQKLPKMKLPVRKGREIEWAEKNLEKIEFLRLLVSTQPGKIGMKKKPEIFEIGFGGTKDKQLAFYKEKSGKEIGIEDVFKEGQFIDLISVTKGKGFGGVVKRFGVKIRGRKDEQHHRQIGVIGTEGMARVLYTIPQPGQLGYNRRTEFNKHIIKISSNPEEINPAGGFVGYGLVRSTWCLVKGSVPGPKKRLVMLRHPIRAKVKFKPVQIQKISLASQQ
jgi:large subunit ribosomal protein L3